MRNKLRNQKQRKKYLLHDNHIAEIIPLVALSILDEIA